MSHIMQITSAVENVQVGIPNMKSIFFIAFLIFSPSQKSNQFL